MRVDYTDGHHLVLYPFFFEVGAGDRIQAIYPRVREGESDDAFMEGVRSSGASVKLWIHDGFLCF